MADTPTSAVRKGKPSFRCGTIGCGGAQPPVVAAVERGGVASERCDSSSASVIGISSLQPCLAQSFHHVFISSASNASRIPQGPSPRSPGTSACNSRNGARACSRSPTCPYTADTSRQTFGWTDDCVRPEDDGIVSHFSFVRDEFEGPLEMLFQEVTMLPSRTRGVAAAIIGLAGVAAIAQTSTPPTPRTISANGAELSYVSQGSGAPVVFVHGAVADLRFWEPQRAAFAKQYRFISYSQRYHGAGGWPDEGKQYSVETHVADLAGVHQCAQVGPGAPCRPVVRRDSGCAARYEGAPVAANADPRGASVFALLGESPEGKVALEEWTQGTVPMMTALKAGDNVGATKQLIALVIGDSVENFDKLPPDLRQGLLDNARTLPLLFAAPQPTITCDALRGIKVPTLIIRGERTPRFFTAINAAVSKCIAGSKAVTITKASHAMSFDNPMEFNRAVMGFIGQHAAQKP